MKCTKLPAGRAGKTIVGLVVRPVKELKRFQKVDLKAGATKTVSFNIITEDVKFFNDVLKYDWEAGEVYRSYVEKGK